MIQLISTNIAGNLHVASKTINQMGLAQYVLTMDAAPSWQTTTVVFKVPADKAPMIRKLLDYAPEAWDNPPHYKLFTGIGDD